MHNENLRRVDEASCQGKAVNITYFCVCVCERERERARVRTSVGMCMRGCGCAG